MTQAFTSTRPNVHVNGEERPQVDEALSNMTVNLPLVGSAHAELGLTNWGLQESAQTPDFAFSDLALGDRLEVFIGEDPSTKIFDGEITGMEERYGEGAPQLLLLLQDKLHRLGRARHSRAFEDQTPDEIVEAIASEDALSSDVSVSSVRSTFHQINESNLAFLFRLLSRFDIALRLEDGTLRARAEEADSLPVTLDAQDNALSVRLLADLNHQQTTARVQGFNAGTDQQVIGSADSLQPSPAGTTAAETLRQLGWSGEAVLPQPFPLSQGEADAFASAHFNSRARRFISGDIRCQGEPELKSGKEVQLEGVSERLLGVYHVVHCVHRFNGESGFETHVKVNRSDWGA